MEEYIEKVDAGLREYVERTILPRYHSFDAAHRIDHVATVIAESLNLAAGHPEVDINMAYAIAAYHDTGLVAGRDRHHEASTDASLPRPTALSTRKLRSAAPYSMAWSTTVNSTRKGNGAVLLSISPKSMPMADICSCGCPKVATHTAWPGSVS